MDPVLTWLAVFLFPQITASESNNHLYYVHKANRTLQRMGFHDSQPVGVSDLSSFPCDILTATVIWNCKLILIGRLCNFTGILEMLIGKFTIHNTSLSRSYHGVTTAVANNTLYVCGWTEPGGDDTSCEYMTRQSMTFQPIPVNFNVSRGSFAMYAFGGRICVFGGMKNTTTDVRTKQTECAEVTHTYTSLNFTNATTHLCWFRGNMAALRIDGLLLFCGGLSKKGLMEAPFCEWLQFNDRVEQQYLSTLNYTYRRIWMLYDKKQMHTRSELVLYGNRITMFYSGGPGITEIISAFAENDLTTKIITWQFNASFEEIKPVSIQDKCIRDTPQSVVSVGQNQISNYTTDMDRKSSVALQMGLSTPQPPCQLSTSSGTINITLGQLVMSICIILVVICFAIAITMLATVRHYSKCFAKVPHYPLSDLPTPISHDFDPADNDSADDSNQPPDRMPSLLQPHYRKEQIDNEITGTKETIDTTTLNSVTPGSESSSIKSIGKLLEKGKILASGLTNGIGSSTDQKTIDQINSSQSMFTATPSGESVHRMNSRAEQSTSEQCVPYEEVALQIVKRMWRKKLKDKAARKV